ncbi:MAG TPA: SRPBCC family protein [Thermoanaerobaculia bacterium]|nr:SRPBCC family protein [Thermoanaerobaculia bacterium]
MLKKIAVIAAVTIAAAIAILLLVAATQPKTFRIERSMTIHASPETIAPLIADFHNWPKWSPYENLDPHMRRTLSGEPRGKGAFYAWRGNSQAGAGQMEIVDETPSRIAIKLDFDEPMEGHNMAEFTLVPVGNTTTVTWAMYGPCPYLGRIFKTLVNVDAMVGKDFEAGLANLRKVAEKQG